jgi:hypothetical protein
LNKGKSLKKYDLNKKEMKKEEINFDDDVFDIKLCSDKVIALTK